MTIEEQFPLCVAAGEDANAFKETELRNTLASHHVYPYGCRLYVEQIKYLNMFIRDIPFTPNDISNCVLDINLPGEEWRPVVGFEDGYAVSNLGRVKAIARMRTLNKSGKLCRNVERLLLGRLDKDGYRVIHCSYKNVIYHFRVHRLVAEAFIPKTEEDIRLGRNIPNHKDGNKLNNCASNLEWTTNQENKDHAIMHGFCSTLQYDDIIRLKKIYESDPNMTFRRLRNEYYPHVSEQAIGDALMGRSLKLFNIDTVTRHKSTRSSLRLPNSILEIRLLRENGVGTKKLSQLFNVSTSSIKRICSRKFYPEITYDQYPDIVAEIKRKYNLANH